MNIIIPKHIKGRKVKGAMQRCIEKEKARASGSGQQPTQPTIPTAPLIVQASIRPEDYIQCGNLFVPKFEQPQFKGENWEDAHKSVQGEGLIMPPPAQFMPHFLNVVNAHNGNGVLLDGNNVQVPADEVKDIYKYLTSGHKGGAWTHLDAKFEKDGDNWFLHTNHRFANRSLTGQKSNLERCVMEDKFCDLKFNVQGLAVKKSRTQKYKQGKNLMFWKPVDGKVAGFYANSDRAYLDCNRSPDNAIASLGVFACAEGALPKNSSGKIEGYVWVPLINQYVAKQKTGFNKNWKQQHAELHQRNGAMITIPQSIEFIKYLQDVKDGNISVSDINVGEAGQILDEMFKVEGNWRAENLDASFSEIGGKMHVSYNHWDVSGSLTAQNTEKLSDYLTQSKTPGIDFQYWLENHNVQGLPKLDCKDGGFYYWQPVGGRVARFYADSGWACLSCDRLPDAVNASLGVREVRSTAP